MPPHTFDTLSASRRLREAGMPEDVAEAVVTVFQHAKASVDFDQLVTKSDIAEMATKADIAEMATKGDIANMATKADIADMATKADVADMATKADIADMATKADIAAIRDEMVTRSDLHILRADISEKFRQHTLAMLGGMAALLGLFTLVGKLVA